MLLYPNCKLNIGLRVIDRRTDGYHDLETIFYPVYGLHDELEVETMPTETVEFIQEGLAVDCPAEDNLIIKCYHMMQAKYPQIGGVRIRFKKNIPFGAGLGGGSSDAAHMAIALNELFGLGLNQAELAEMVRPLGADCPFFIYNTPCYAEGIGDKLRPIRFDLSGLRLVMIKPACGVSTREAYSGIVRHPEVRGQMVETLNKSEGMTGRDILRQHPDIFLNDFEQTVFPLHPEIAAQKKRLQDAGALYAAMSGSGSTVFGLFEDHGKGSTLAGTAMTEQEATAMVIFDDTLGERKA